MVAGLCVCVCVVGRGWGGGREGVEGDGKGRGVKSRLFLVLPGSARMLVSELRQRLLQGTQVGHGCRVWGGVGVEGGRG